METIDDVSADPSNPQRHESDEKGSSIGCCPGPAAASSDAAEQLATNLAFELSRWELRARIVANQPAEDIAHRMGLPTSLVEQFEAEHFNVRHKLPHSSVVLGEVIGVPLNETWQPAETARLWQWIGFRYGASILDLVIPPFVALSDELQAQGLLAYLHPQCDVNEEFRILVAAKLLPSAALFSEDGM